MNTFNMRITFFYRGRYFLLDAVTVEYLSAIANELGHKTSLLFDQDLFGISDNVLPSSWYNSIFNKDIKLVRKILKEDTDCLVFIDPIGSNNKWISDLAKTIKIEKSHLKIVVLSCLKDYPDYDQIDHLLVGEPEFVFKKFLEDSYSNKKKYLYADLVDLNELPLPDKTLFGPYANYKDSYMVFTSKGCPYSCSYCIETVLNNEMGPNYFRRRSPQNVMAELKKAKEKYSISEVIFKDSIFGFDKYWLRVFLKEYKKYIDLPYKCFAKASVFDEETAIVLKDSKCYCVEFGVQTFNESLKKDVLSRQEKTESIIKAFEICDNHKLMYDADHIFGIPGETINDHIQAAKIYSKRKYLNRVKCHNLVFYKKAGIFNHAPDEIKKDPDYRQDFFSSTAGSQGMILANKCFEKYFKCLPLLSGRISSYVQRDDKWKVFRFVPNFIVLISMILIAIKNNDKRFGIYLKYYPKKIFFSAFR